MPISIQPREQLGLIGILLDLLVFSHKLNDIIIWPDDGAVWNSSCGEPRMFVPDYRWDNSGLKNTNVNLMVVLDEKSGYHHSGLEKYESH